MKDTLAMQPERANVAIAGGTSGLGLATGIAFSKLGANISICGRRQGALDQAVSTMRASGSMVHGVSVDVTATGQPDAWLSDAREAFGGLDLLVAAIGGNRSPSDWEGVFSDNLFWVVRAIRWCEQNMDEGGSIVLVSSIAARVPRLSEDVAAYGAAKRALEYVTRESSERLGRRGIRLNAVAPGPVADEGGRWEHQTDDHPGLVRALENATALGRFVTADEVASCVLYLASPAASGVTGATLRCDAGMEAHLP